MVRTRNMEISAEAEGQEGQTMEQPHENDTTLKSPVEALETSADTTTGEKKNESTPKSNDRMARFKALQARAVSDP